MIDILIKVDLVLAKLEKINEFNLHFSSSYLFFFPVCDTVINN